MTFRLAALATALVLFDLAALAQASRTPSGHWQAAMKVQNQDFEVVVDLTRNQSGQWVGTFSMPDIEVKDLPLTRVAVTPTGVGFTVSGLPGTPSFDGKLSADGKTLSGALTDSKQMKTPLSFKRTGVAKLALPTANAPLAKVFEGAWHGTPEGGKAAKIQFELKLARNADGTAKGTMTVVDWGNIDSPLTSFSQDGKFLQFENKALSGKFRGALNETGA
ncbi:MAG TPA: hypothetical protein VGH38_30175, partial [Bryobacteraceae bacterium]